MTRTSVFRAAALASLMLASCGTMNSQVKKDIDATQTARSRTLEVPVRIAPTSRVEVIKGRLLPATAVSGARSGEWLKQIRVELRIENPTPLSAVIGKLSSQGINIVSDLPLDAYSYVGKVNSTDGDAALRIVLGTVGLDYQTDDARKLVLIKPMAVRTWYLAIGNRKSSYISDGMQSSSSGSSGSSSGGSNQSGQTSGTGSATGSNQMGNAGAGTNTGSGSNPGQSGFSSGGSSGTGATGGSGTNSTGVMVSDDFWGSLAAELKTRLTILVPRSMAIARTNTQPGLPQLPGMANQPPRPNMDPLMGGGQMGGEMYVSRLMGSFSLNPDTGAVTVQAPHWILRDLDLYFKRTQEMYNTDITFEGEIVLVTSNRTDGEGLDVSAFARWASGKYGLAVSNNTLGGVTISVPSGGAPSIVAGAQAVGGPLVGLAYQGANTALDVFNAYLSEVGKVSVIQRPLVTTSHGVPGSFSKKQTDYYNTVTQNAAAGGTGSAATATVNTLVPVEFGTDLRINPRIDMATGLVRAQLTLKQVINSGTKTVPQIITIGNTSQTINSLVPLSATQKIEGEILLRDGDLIVVGGQTEDNLSTNENGLPGQDGPMTGALGMKRASRGNQTYYFALRVVINKRQ